MVYGGGGFDDGGIAIEKIAGCARSMGAVDGFVACLRTSWKERLVRPSVPPIETLDVFNVSLAANR